MALALADPTPAAEPPERPAAAAPSSGGARPRCPRGMVIVRGGGPFELAMLEGSSVAVTSFCLDRTEVTVRDHAACVARGACSPAQSTVDWPGISAEDRGAWSALCNGAREDRGAHPVNCVDWTQADAYCRAAGKRLPTEAEWEWAARNGARGTHFPWGDAPAGDRVCWNVERGGEPGRLTGTCPVATHPAGDTSSGLADLGGNVWEWTASLNHGGPERVVRGGGWYYNSPDAPSASHRAWNPPALRSSTVGFRCAADPAPARENRPRAVRQ